MAIIEEPGTALSDASVVVTVRRAGPSVVVAFTGELDIASAAATSRVLYDLIDDQGNLTLDLDVSGLSFIDSSGLNVLVEAHRHLLVRGGHLTLVDPTASTRRVLEICGLLDVLDVRTSP